MPRPMDTPLRRPGRPAVISREAIADAAIALVRERGTDSLTLQNVAAELGVKHPALYRHVDGRLDLLRAVADRFLETTAWPTPQDDWRQYLREVAQTIDVECGRLPGMTSLMFSEVWPLPRQLILLAMDIAENLVGLGFPRDLALTAADIVGDFAADARMRRDRLAAHSERLDAFTQALPDEDAEVSSRLAAFDAHFAAGPDVWAERKLDIILDGISAQLTASRN